MLCIMSRMVWLLWPRKGPCRNKIFRWSLVSKAVLSMLLLGCVSSGLCWVADLEFPSPRGKPGIRNTKRRMDLLSGSNVVLCWKLGTMKRHAV